MNDPATAEVWQTAFGKDFGGMAQGCKKTGQAGTNAMFVMTHKEIMHALAAKKFFMYANPVVDYRPQKEDPHQIRITAGGNLITYEGNASVWTADIDTAKLHWNSVISMPDAKYMCLDIKKNYLTASLKYFEYMNIPLTLFPEWTQEQYNLKQLALDGWVCMVLNEASSFNVSMLTACLVTIRCCAPLGIALPVTWGPQRGCTRVGVVNFRWGR